MAAALAFLESKAEILVTKLPPQALDAMKKAEDTELPVVGKLTPPKVVLLVGGVLLLLFFLILYIAGYMMLITSLVGFAYPAYMSFAVIGKEDSEESANVRKQWLTYWVVYSLVSLVEAFLEPILAFVLPVNGAPYQVSKTGFLVYCFYAKDKKTGAQVVYDALSPLVAKAVDALHLVGDKQD